MIEYSLLDSIKRKIKYRGVVAMKKGEIKAVHDDDLITLLVSLGVHEDVKLGNSRCYFCQDTITLENIECVFPLNNVVEFCCAKTECKNALFESSEING